MWGAIISVAVIVVIYVTVKGGEQLDAKEKRKRQAKIEAYGEELEEVKKKFDESLSNRYRDYFGDENYIKDKDVKTLQRLSILRRSGGNTRRKGLISGLTATSFSF